MPVEGYFVSPRWMDCEPSLALGLLAGNPSKRTTWMEGSFLSVTVEARVHAMTQATWLTAIKMESSLQPMSRPKRHRRPRIPGTRGLTQNVRIGSVRFGRGLCNSFGRVRCPQSIRVAQALLIQHQLPLVYVNRKCYRIADVVRRGKERGFTTEGQVVKFIRFELGNKVFKNFDLNERAKTKTGKLNAYVLSEKLCSELKGKVDLSTLENADNKPFLFCDGTGAGSIFDLLLEGGSTTFPNQGSTTWVPELISSTRGRSVGSGS